MQMHELITLVPLMVGNEDLCNNDIEDVMDTYWNDFN